MSHLGLLDNAWEVARRFRDHDAYVTPVKAVKALRRRCPGYSDRQYTNAFEKGLALHKAALAAVAADARSLLQQTNVRVNQFPDFGDLARQLKRQCPGFRVSTCRSALLWILFWYHLK